MLRCIFGLIALCFAAAVSANDRTCSDYIDGSIASKELDFQWFEGFHRSMLMAKGVDGKFTDATFSERVWSYCEIYPDTPIPEAAKNTFEALYK